MTRPDPDDAHAAGVSGEVPAAPPEVAQCAADIRRLADIYRHTPLRKTLSREERAEFTTAREALQAHAAGGVVDAYVVRLRDRTFTAGSSYGGLRKYARIDDRADAWKSLTKLVEGRVPPREISTLRQTARTNLAKLPEESTHRLDGSDPASVLIRRLRTNEFATVDADRTDFKLNASLKRRRQPIAEHDQQALAMLSLVVETADAYRTQGRLFAMAFAVVAGALAY